MRPGSAVMHTPLVSVVLPAYNAAAFLHEALDSIFSQKIAVPFEVIVVDDGSQDQTAAIAESYSNPVRLLQKSNGGPGSARNHGVLNARADLILFMDADDKALPGWFDSQVNYILEHPEIAAAFGSFQLQGRESQDELTRLGHDYPVGDYREEPALLSLLASGRIFFAGGDMILRKNAILEVGMQREDVFVAEDLDLWCRIAANFRVSVTRRPLCWVRRQGHSHLMASPHVYVGPAVVHADVLRKFGERLAPAQFQAAHREFERRAEFLLRYEWACKGRGAVLQWLETLAPLLSERFRARWRRLSRVPAVLPRAARKAMRLARRWRRSVCE